MAVNDDWNYDEYDDWDAADRGDDHGYESLDLNNENNSGHRLRSCRLYADISSDELADDADISHTDLLAIEAGLLPMDRELASKLAQCLGVHLNDIWNDEDWTEDAWSDPDDDQNRWLENDKPQADAA